MPPIADPESRTWPRQCARGAMLAPLAAVLVMCLAGPIKNRQPADVAQQVNFIASTTALLILATGLAAGVAGLAGGLRRRSRDTAIIAGLGLFLTGSLAAFWLAMLLWWWMA